MYKKEYPGWIVQSACSYHAAEHLLNESVSLNIPFTLLLLDVQLSGGSTDRGGFFLQKQPVDSPAIIVSPSFFLLHFPMKNPLLSLNSTATTIFQSLIQTTIFSFSWSRCFLPVIWIRLSNWPIPIEFFTEYLQRIFTISSHKLIPFLFLPQRVKSIPGNIPWYS